MHLSQQIILSSAILMVVFIIGKTFAVESSSSSSSSSTIRTFRCLKRNDHQIICPTDQSKEFSNLKLGPNMYHRRFTIGGGASKTAENMAAGGVGGGASNGKFKTHVIYYTKQYQDGDLGGQNAFDLSDQDEYNFMHDDKVKESIIDDGHLVKTVNKIKIQTFIDDNKAMIRRMFGDYSGWSEDGDDHFDDYFIRDHYSSFHDGATGNSNRQGRTKQRPKRSINSRPTPLSGNKVDSCESSVEIVTPYWASNSAGKIRAIVNTQHLQQAIQQEVCQAVQTHRCNKDCRCEQKYKWHRLLAYDPDDDCKGIFMDWFLFPSCCVCRCTKY